ncbi:hypothetical protein QE152_g16950 [Popillia japonica]|uniref:Uncharacterized protein n=1 Tax=Popillia japonica TaxID=7064 RepID=A0AAW1L6A9_POPJA
MIGKTRVDDGDVTQISIYVGGYIINQRNLRVMIGKTRVDDGDVTQISIYVGGYIINQRLLAKVISVAQNSKSLSIDLILSSLDTASQEFLTNIATPPCLKLVRVKHEDKW